MTRIVALVLLAILVWILLEWGYRKLMGAMGLDPATGRRGSAHGTRRAGAPDGPTESLVRCDACGAYVPASRTLAAGGAARACSETCRHRLRRPS